MLGGGLLMAGGETGPTFTAATGDNNVGWWTTEGAGGIFDETNPAGSVSKTVYIIGLEVWGIYVDSSNNLHCLFEYTNSASAIVNNVSTLGIIINGVEHTLSYLDITGSPSNEVWEEFGSSVSITSGQTYSFEFIYT